MKYTKKRLEKAAKNSESIYGVLRELGITYQSGGIHSHISRRLKEFDIDTSHFLGRGWSKGKHALNRRSPEEVLILRESGRRQRREILKRVLFEIGFEYKCEICELEPEWNGLSLTLHIDHKNGNFLDDRKENLRFLCPNCHSQV